MLLLSDGLPNSTLASLDRHFPYASKLGLLTESTPFLTNRPYTLFENESVHESGAVGLAFCDSQHGGSGHVGAQYVARTNVEMGIEYPGLETLSGIETIDHAQGNLLLTIYPSSNASFEAQTNPTQLLIRAINEYNARSKAERPSDAANAEKGVKLGKRMKEEEWYLAIWGVDQDARHQPVSLIVFAPMWKSACANVSYVFAVCIPSQGRSFASCRVIHREAPCHSRWRSLSVEGNPSSSCTDLDRLTRTRLHRVKLPISSSRSPHCLNKTILFRRLRLFQGHQRANPFRQR